MSSSNPPNDESNDERERVASNNKPASESLHDDAMLMRFDRLRSLEAFIFASPEPVPLARLKDLLPKSRDVPLLLEELRKFYEQRGVQLVQRGKAWAFRTDPALADALAPHKKQKRRLSRQALETLAIIAYKQPVTRPEIESLRGVSVSRGVFSTLLEHKWIAPGARRKIPGRPLTWTTTDAFLDHFGLTSLDSLPGGSDLPQEKATTPKEAGRDAGEPSDRPYLPLEDFEQEES